MQQLRQYGTYALELAVLFVVYYATARFGLSENTVHTFAAFIWPPTGIAIAAVYYRGYRIAPAIFLGAFAANFVSHAGILTAFLIAIGNTCEAMAMVYLVRQTHFNPLFSRLQDSIIYIGAALNATFISAFIGIIALLLSNLAPLGDAGITWLAWWLGDFLSALIIGTFLLRWFSHPLSESRRTPKESFEIFAFLLTMVMFVVIIFLDPFQSLSKVTLPYLTFIPLIWGALRVGPRFLTASLFIVTYIAVLGTSQQTGPFVGENQFFLLQIFLGILATVFLSFVSAIEERKEVGKRLQEQVEQLDDALKKIRSTDRAKNDFLAILSHELRNPLSPVVSALDVLRLEGEKNKNSDLHSLVETMYQNIYRIIRLLDDLLDISRISRNKFKLQKAPVFLDTIVDHALEMSRALIEKQGHTLSVSLPSTPLWLEVDALRIEQTLVNLLNNSAKYTPPGGSLSLVCRPVKNTIEITVADNGIGISQEMIKEIFEPFRQGAESSSEHPGLGVGLSLTQKLVELHSGVVEAKSEGIGHGSQFTVRLPLPAQEPMPEILVTQSKKYPPLRAPAAISTKASILVVDADAATALGLAELLKIAGYATTVAHDSTRARALVTSALSKKPDIILIDIETLSTDSTNESLAKDLRANAPKTILVEVLDSEKNPRPLGAAPDFDLFIKKPIRIKELEKVLSRIPVKQSPSVGK